MKFPTGFYKATESYNTYEKHVNAPFLRYETCKKTDCKTFITVSGLGFYDIFVNGKKITKGLLAPYISNPNHFVYYDIYDLTSLLIKGDNAISVILGCGWLNPLGGATWGFTNADWRSSERLSLVLVIINFPFFSTIETI